MARPFFRRRKSCPFSGDDAPVIDYKDVKLLQGFMKTRPGYFEIFIRQTIQDKREIPVPEVDRDCR